METPAAALLPTLSGDRVALRPGGHDDVPALMAILTDPSVAHWWGVPSTPEEVDASLRGGDGESLLVVEVEGAIAGGVYYHEENEPDYRHASVDIFLGGALQGRGLGRETLSLLIRWLIEERGHHRITIDPAAHNERAIRCYEAVGFRRVGLMRKYERGRDGTWHDGMLMDLLADEFERGR